ncbi:MAG: hypothetical protein ABIR79_21010 [Candidatus Binatia bacterium]
MIRRLPLLLGGAALFSGLWACDSLSDPGKDTTPEGPTARVSGALSGTVPAHTRVAVVWATKTGLGRGADVAVDNGHFTIDLGAVPADALFDPSVDDSSNIGGYDPPPSVGGGSGGPDQVTASSDGGISTQTVASGTTISVPIRIGQAGFIVYVDENDNHQLDFDAHGSTTDTIIGANRDFVLTYLQNGSTVDYEKYRDRANTALSLPQEGFNLRWEGGDGWRWWSLDQVQLEVTQTSLPSIVCSALYDDGNFTSVVVDAAHSVCWSDDYPTSGSGPGGTTAYPDGGSVINASADASAPPSVDAGPISIGIDSGVQE